MSRQIFINSKDRISGTSSNFLVNMNISIEYADYLQLLNVRIPNTFYNVNSYNNQITFIDNLSVTHTITIPNGSYNINNLLTAIQTALNAASALVFTLTYNSTTFKLTISTTDNFQLLFGSGLNQLNYLLGFSSIDLNGANSYTSDLCVSLSFNYIVIKIDEIGRTAYYSTNKRDEKTFIIPINEPSGSYVEYDHKQYFYQCADTRGKVLSQLNISLFSPGGNPLNLNGSDWYMILEPKEEHKNKY